MEKIVAVRLCYVEDHGEDCLEVWLVDFQLQAGGFWHDAMVLEVEDFGHKAELLCRAAAETMAKACNVPMREACFPVRHVAS